MDIKKDISWRVHLVFLGIICLGLGVLARSIYIQQFQGDYWQGLSDKQHLRYQTLQADRGTIFSEDGNVLSTSIPVYDIRIDFRAGGIEEKNGKRFFDNLDSLSFLLSGLFKDASAAQYKSRLLKGYKKKDRYYLLKRKISFEDYMVLRTFPLVRSGSNRGGFIIEPNDSRVNPYVLLANRTIGLSRGDTSKNVGLERAYDSVLRGISGKRLMRYISGSYIPVEGFEVEPEEGKDITTTIDTYIQDIAENALLKMLKENNSQHGAVVVMEVKTGKIKAIANLGRMPDGRYWEDYNYALGKRTEPGSTFKLLSLLSLLEDGFIDTGSVVTDYGGHKSFHGLTIRDAHHGIGNMTVNRAFAVSSNVVFADLINTYYSSDPQRFINHLKNLGLNKKLDVGISGTAAPFIKDPSFKYWSRTSLPFIAHGYESLITPLQMLTIYNAVANNGVMMKPYLVNSISRLGMPVQNFEPQVLNKKIASKETIQKLKSALLGVVETKSGTAYALRSNDFEFAGKTGTAVTADNNKGYKNGGKTYQASFMGFFPYADPVYSVAVVIQNSRESTKFYGGSVAGPVFKDIANQIYMTRMGGEPIGKFVGNNIVKPVEVEGRASDLDNIFKTLGYESNLMKSGAGNWYAAYLHGSDVKTVRSKAKIDENVVPSVIGMKLNDAIQFLENAGLEVKIRGKGKVIKQSPAGNSAFKNGDVIQLELN